MLTDPHEDYARGFVPFLGVDVYLDSRPLIPRTETEYWAEKAIAEMPAEKEFRALDMFAGSGCIGLAVMQHRPLATVTFAEYEARHLPTIHKSIEKNNLNHTHASVVQGDLWSGVAGLFEFILANPPYVSEVRETTDTSTSIEPREALYAPDDGFYFIEKILQGLPYHLAQNGVCYIEHEPFHAERIKTVGDVLGYSVETLPDQYSIMRYSRLKIV